MATTSHELHLGGRTAVGRLHRDPGKRLHNPVERIPAAADLGRWFHEAGLADRPVVVSPRTFPHALALREALYRLLTGTTLAADVDVVNRWSTRPLPGPRLTRELQAETTTDAAGLLSMFARDAIELLTGPLAGWIEDILQSTLRTTRELVSVSACVHRRLLRPRRHNCSKPTRSSC